MRTAEAPGRCVNGLEFNISHISAKETNVTLFFKGFEHSDYSLKCFQLKKKTTGWYTKLILRSMCRISLDALVCLSRSASLYKAAFSCMCNKS